MKPSSKLLKAEIPNSQWLKVKLSNFYNLFGIKLKLLQIYSLNEFFERLKPFKWFELKKDSKIVSIEFLSNSASLNYNSWSWQSFYPKNSERSNASYLSILTLSKNNYLRLICSPKALIRLERPVESNTLFLKSRYYILMLSCRPLHISIKTSSSTPQSTRCSLLSPTLAVNILDIASAPLAFILT